MRFQSTHPTNWMNGTGVFIFAGRHLVGNGSCFHDVTIIQGYLYTLHFWHVKVFLEVAKFLLNWPLFRTAIFATFKLKVFSNRPPVVCLSFQSNVSHSKQAVIDVDGTHGSQPLDLSNGKILFQSRNLLLTSDSQAPLISVLLSHNVNKRP